MIYYLPLEPYKERYTLQLSDWTVQAFKRLNVSYQIVEGRSLRGGQIFTGEVLDAHGRSHYALTQTAALVNILATTQVKKSDVIYIDDMFHPGWEALPYILSRMSGPPRVFTRCYAQSVDPNDFTFSMRHWMRHYELMVDQTCDGIFLASTCQVDMLRSAMFQTPLHTVGLVFDANEVRQRAGPVNPLKDRKKRIVFASRFDAEKQPHFFMNLVDAVYDQNLLPGYTFEICTGSKKLRSNLPGAVSRARALQAAGRLVISEGLDKFDYYQILKNSQLQFNCALQDFVSYTLLEASALGTPSLLPAYLSFPEALFHNAQQLYIPWSLKDAIDKMVSLLEQPPPLDIIARPSVFHSLTIDRIVDTFEGINESG